MKKKFKLKTKEVDHVNRKEDFEDEEEQIKINLTQNSKFLNHDKYTNHHRRNLVNIRISQKEKEERRNL